MEKTMYEKVEWPEIQEYMEDDDYEDKVYYNPINNVWFVPEYMVKRHEIRREE